MPDLVLYQPAINPGVVVTSDGAPVVAVAVVVLDLTFRHVFATLLVESALAWYVIALPTFVSARHCLPRFIFSQGAMMLPTLIDLFLTSCRAAGLAPKTVTWYSANLRAWSAFIGSRDWLDPDVSRQFIVNLQSRSLSVFTVRGYVRTIKRFFNWCESEGRIPANPARRLRMPKPPRRMPRAISEEDFAAILAAATTPRDRALLLLLRDTGCRAGEVCGLKVADVDLGRGIALVLGKGCQERFVFLGERTRAAVGEWLRERGACSAEDQLFTARRGACKPSTIYQLLKRLAYRAGVTTRFNPHSLRHAFGRDWVKSGGDISALADIMGHSDLETTRVYLRFRTEELQAMHRKHSPVR